MPGNLKCIRGFGGNLLLGFLLVLAGAGLVLQTGCDGGKAKKTGDSKEVKRVRVFKKPEKQPPNPAVTAITAGKKDGKDTVFVGTTNGIFFLEDEEWKEIPLSPGGPAGRVINCIMNETNRGVWVGTDDGIYYYNWMMWIHHDEGKTNALGIDQDGYVWAGTNYGLKKFTKVWDRYLKDNSNLPHNDVSVIEADPKGTLWVGTKQGLVILNGQQPQSWEQMTGSALRPTPDGKVIEERGNTQMVGNTILAIAWDQKGYTAIATNRGINIMKDKRDWTLLAADDCIPIGTPDGGIETRPVKGNCPLLSNWVRKIYVDERGALWIATRDGLSVYTTTGWENYHSPDPLPSNDVTGIAVIGQDIYIATRGGIVKNIYEEVKE